MQDKYEALYWNFHFVKRKNCLRCGGIFVIFCMHESRLKKLEWMIKDIIPEIIFEETAELEADFWIITVTWVKLSSDLSYLDVFVSSFLNQENLPKGLAEFNHEIQRKLNKKLPLYKLPRIRFRYDDSWERMAEVDSLIKKLKKEKK